MPDIANAAQIAQTAEQVVRAAITQLRVEYPELITMKEPPVPPLIKWIVSAIAALGLLPYLAIYARIIVRNYRIARS